MNNPCSVTQALNMYHTIQDSLTVSEKQLARDQLELVRDMANRFINNGTFTRNKLTQFVAPGRVWYAPVSTTYSIRDAAKRCKDGIEEDWFIKHLNDPAAANRELDALMALATDEVAFEALDLDSNPFVSLETLKITAGA